MCSNVEDVKPWYYDILQYLQTQTYPFHATENEKRTLRRMARSFYLDGPHLYKKGFSGEMMRCVDKAEADHIIAETHEGLCATHANGHALTRQIMRRGYYWSTMEKDCILYVRKCPKCQAYADKIEAPPVPLYSMVSPWPFSQWGIDVIGVIHPQATNGHKFILVAIDYFTKWIEAQSYAKITRKAVARFIKINLICRFGVPQQIITDNATNLNGGDIDRICDQFKIKHRNSTPYRPQMNGAVEAANKNIKKIISKMTQTYKDWHEMLPFALMGYRTSIRTSTGATPYCLAYGMEAVLPIEVEVPSLRILQEAKIPENEWNKARYEQLNLIEEKRLRAIFHGQLYQARIARAFDKKVKPRTFHPGDLVLRKVNPAQPDSRGKWKPNYEGPYVVKHVFSGGALVLADVDGNVFQKPVNSDTVKIFYS